MTETQRKKAWERRAVEIGYNLPTIEVPEKFLPKNLSATPKPQ